MPNEPAAEHSSQLTGSPSAEGLTRIVLAQLGHFRHATGWRTPRWASVPTTWAG